MTGSQRGSCILWVVGQALREEGAVEGLTGKETRQTEVGDEASSERMGAVECVVGVSPSSHGWLTHSSVDIYSVDIC